MQTCVSNGSLWGEKRGLKSGFGRLPEDLLVQGSSAVLCPTQTRDLVLLQREFVVVGDLFVDGDGLLGVDHDLLLGLDGDHFGVTVRLEEGRRGYRDEQRRRWRRQRGGSLTVQQWLMNLARFPHLVASMMVSWSTRNR